MNEGYALLALLARYVFLLLGIVIVLRTVRLMLSDARAYRREMNRLPDAGMIGEMVDVNTGERFPIPKDGVIGSARGCDIRLKNNGIARHHAYVSYEPGKGVKITPINRRRVFLEGVEMRSACCALHGTALQIGPRMLTVRLFAGLNVPHPASFAPMPSQYAPPLDPYAAAGENQPEYIIDPDLFFDQTAAPVQPPAMPVQNPGDNPEEDDTDYGSPFTFMGG